MGSTSAMDAINVKIQSYGSLKVELKSVDAQESYSGGVLVLVTGFMVNADNSKRAFIQTFFLAPQDKGYFVLNDLFRYVEDYSCQNKRQDGGMEPTTPEKEEAPPVLDNHIAEESNGEVYNPCENADVSVEDEEEVEDEPMAEVVDEAPNDKQIKVELVESNAKVVDEPQNDS